MGQAEALEAFAAWVDAGLVRSGWSEPLTLSLRLTGAKALALGACKAEAPFHLIGWSAGAPVEFLSLCRDLSDAPARAGLQERPLSGTGKICWSVIAEGDCIAVVLGLYDRHGDSANLHQLAEIAHKCVKARTEARAPQTAAH